MAAVPSRFWIFQALPERYDLAARLNPRRTDNWIVSSFEDDIGEGDFVYMWQASSEEALFGWAKVNSGLLKPAATRSTKSSRSEIPQPRVELLYEARFDPPITRTEIRSHEKLADLAVLQTARGTNFRVDPLQALALNELARARGFETPPDPLGVSPTPPPTIGWERLSPAAQDVCAWAAASEDPNPRVGTRGLLIGLLRTSHPSEAVQLLDYAGVRREELFRALQQVRVEARINPTVGQPTILSSLPALTPNAEQTLETAFQLQRDPSRLVDVQHLFGGILEVTQSRASQALERVLEGRVPVASIRTTYPDYLERAVPQSYGTFLQERFAGARPSTAITTDTWTDRDQLEHLLYASAIAEFIRDEKTQAPLTIGIKAPWGAGKTSLMRMIRNELDPKSRAQPATDKRLTIWEFLWKTRARTPDEAANELEPRVERHFTTVWFNAWKYQSSEQLWAGLAHAILSQVGERLDPIDCDRLWASIHVRRVRLAELRHGFYRYISLHALPYMLVALIAVAGVLITWIIAPGLLQGASIVGVVLGVISVGTGIVRSVTDEVTKAIPQLVEEPDYTSRLGFLHLVDSDMNRILRAAGATPREPFVIFIDDLDRCTYGTVAQVIEALNVFLAGDFDNCIFVIAMEPDLVAAQIHIAYRDLFDRLGEDGGGDLGWRFLEKMVQLPLALPEPGRPQVERFVDSILIVETEAEIADVADNALEIENQREAIRKVQTTKTPEGVAEAMEQVREGARAKGTATAESDAALRKAARLEFKDVFSDALVRAILMRHAADLSGNPREIKRFVNVFRFYAYVDFWRKTDGFKTPGLEGAAKLARIAIGWPSLLSALATEVNDNGNQGSLLALLEKTNNSEAAWDHCVELAPERARAQLAKASKLREVITRRPHVGANVAGFL